MSLFRQNTDYALRVMVHLAQFQDHGCISARQLAEQQDISSQFACKILQQLHEARLVQSTLGAKGGYRLSRPAGMITMLEVIQAAQGPLNLHRCLEGLQSCPRQGGCPVRGKFTELQGQIDGFLGRITLAELAGDREGRL
ncbi:MAG: Rrf2 family transcriptional regulator [Sedimentisphaerales bacterium]|nr:Rrf2 family transcriptional regulator [Sedimentisphaerales bacterium]